MDPTIVIPILVAVVAASLAAFGIMVYRQYAGTRSLDARLDRLTGQQVPTLESAGILREPVYPDDARSFIDRLLPQLPSLEKLFEQADFRMQPAQFWILSGGLALVGALLPVVLGWSIVLAPFGMAILAPIPFLYVLWLRKQRLDKFASQLSEALELVARALRAGHSLAAAMHTVAEEMPKPISAEFGRVYEEQNLGLSIESAMRNLSERVPNLDLKFFVTAVIIQRTTGGDLAEILDKIGYVIRERFKIMGMVKALTGEGRISGVVLIALPFLLFFMMLNINYEYVKLLWTHELGQKMSVFGLIAMVIGALVIRKIVNIKI